MNKFKKTVQSKGFFIIISVFLAVISWLLVLNTSNPIVERTLEIPLTILNKNHPATLDLSDQTVACPDTVTVTVSGRRDTINNLTVKELSAAVDLKEIKSKGNTTLKVSKPECSRLGISVQNYYPKEIEFVFDTESQRYLDIVVDYDDSLLAENFEFISVIAEPDKIPVVGLTNIIDTVDYIQVDLNDAITQGSVAGDRTASFIGKYISTMGEDITSSFGTEKITVHITVAKRVPVKYSVKGKPDGNYYYDTDSITNDSVLLRGDASVLSKIKEINLGTIDMTDKNTSFSSTFNLQDYIPEGTSVYGESETKVNVRLVKYSTKVITIKSGNVSYFGKDNSTYNYKITPNSINVTVKGKAEDINYLTATSISPTVDLTNRTVGEYNIILEFRNLDKNKVTIVGEAPYFHIVIENIPVQEPEPPVVVPPQTEESEIVG
ncbi:MAG: hypothetical protein IKJ75_02015 [Clostridia bacterium]|nr:hypothetical protein [Clostridia bacterium]